MSIRTVCYLGGRLKEFVSGVTKACLFQNNMAYIAHVSKP